MNVLFMQFSPDGDRCLWDEQGNARIINGKYSANDNHPMFHETYVLLRHHNAIMDYYAAKREVAEANIDASLVGTQREIERLMGERV